MEFNRIGKFLAVIVLSWSVIGCSSSTTDESEQKIDGFYFSFDELEPNGGTYEGKVTDHSGSNFHGETDSIRGVAGKIGSGAGFWGNKNASIQLDSISDYFPFENGFTLRVWIEPVFGGHQQIIGSTKNRLPGSEGDGFGVALVGSYIVFELPEIPNYDIYRSPQLMLPVDAWFHIAVTYDGENLSYYYNGSLVGTDTIVTTFKSEFHNHIGNELDVNNDAYSRKQFLSNLDELYLESRVMTSGEIMEYYLDSM